MIDFLRTARRWQAFLKCSQDAASKPAWSTNPAAAMSARISSGIARKLASATLAQAHELARDVIRPRAAETDRTEQYPGDSVATLRKAGFMGYTIPCVYGGASGAAAPLPDALLAGGALRNPTADPRTATAAGVN
jgi:alkylation response protein AidB-like acyl-CoA dehydrogenase